MLILLYNVHTMMKQRMALTIVVVLLTALCLTHAAVFRVPPTYVLNSGTTYDFIFSGFTKIGFTRIPVRFGNWWCHSIHFFPLKTDRDVKVSRQFFWSRSRSHSNWSWSRCRSHEVLVSVSYSLVSWSQIHLVFLKCNDSSDCVPCYVNTHIWSLWIFNYSEIVIIIDYSLFIILNI